MDYMDALIEYPQAERWTCPRSPHAEQNRPSFSTLHNLEKSSRMNTPQKGTSLQNVAHFCEAERLRI
jgi:hypothetical protein